jgi:hypothetical protein
MAPPRTAATLLTALTAHGARPRVEGRELVCDIDLPALLGQRLIAIHTGVRAILNDRPWYGCDAETGFAEELNPATPIPVRFGLLCVGGDAKWDRIHDWARESLPDLFRDDGKRTKPLASRASARSGRRIYFIPLRN